MIFGLMVGGALFSILKLMSHQMIDFEAHLGHLIAHYKNRIAHIWYRICASLFANGAQNQHHYVLYEHDTYLCGPLLTHITLISSKSQPLFTYGARKNWFSLQASTILSQRSSYFQSPTIYKLKYENSIFSRHQPNIYSNITHIGSN